MAAREENLGSAGMLCLLGIAQKLQVAILAYGRPDLAGIACVSVDSHTERLCWASLCGLWRDIHHGVTVLAVAR